MKVKPKNQRYPPLSLSILASTPDIFPSPLILAQSISTRQNLTNRKSPELLSSQTFYNDKRANNKSPTQLFITSARLNATTRKSPELTIDTLYNNKTPQQKAKTPRIKIKVFNDKVSTPMNIARAKEKASFNRFISTFETIKDVRATSEIKLQKTLLGLNVNEEEEKRKDWIQAKKNLKAMRNEKNGRFLALPMSRQLSPTGIEEINKPQKPILDSIETELFKLKQPETAPFDPKGNHIKDIVGLLPSSSENLQNKLDFVHLQTVTLAKYNENDMILDQNMAHLKTFKSSIVKLYKWNLKNKMRNDVKNLSNNKTKFLSESNKPNTDADEDEDNPKSKEKENDVLAAYEDINDVLDSRLPKKKMILRQQKVEERAQKQNLRDDLPHQIGLASWNLTPRVSQKSTNRSEKKDFFLISPEDLIAKHGYGKASRGLNFGKKLSLSHRGDNSVKLKINDQNHQISLNSALTNTAENQSLSQTLSKNEDISSTSKLLNSSKYSQNLVNNTKKFSQTQKKVIKLVRKPAPPPESFYELKDGKLVANEGLIDQRSPSSPGSPKRYVSPRESTHEEMQGKYKRLTMECSKNARSSLDISTKLNLNFKLLNRKLDKLESDMGNNESEIDRQIRKDIYAHLNNLTPVPRNSQRKG